jgi:hypothetical protein
VPLVGVPSSLAPGTYYFGAIADDLGAVIESNETNNALSASIVLSMTQGTCANPYNLTPGQSFNGNTLGGQSSFGSYGCVSWDESGPERVHKITLNSSTTLNATLSNLGVGVDLDVFILSSCNAGSCLAYGDDSASANLGPGTYYILVDGFSGAIVAYTLSVSASSSSTDTIGLYYQPWSVFQLRNSNATGYAELTFQFGSGGSDWVPLVGDWDGNGTDTIGLYYKPWSVFYLRNSNATGYAELVFQFGSGGAGWFPLIGDWDGL